MTSIKKLLKKKKKRNIIYIYIYIYIIYIYPYIYIIDAENFYQNRMSTIDNRNYMHVKIEGVFIDSFVHMRQFRTSEFSKLNLSCKLNYVRRWGIFS